MQANCLLLQHARQQKTTDTKNRRNLKKIWGQALCADVIERLKEIRSFPPNVEPTLVWPGCKGLSVADDNPGRRVSMILHLGMDQKSVADPARKSCSVRTVVDYHIGSHWCTLQSIDAQYSIILFDRWAHPVQPSGWHSIENGNHQLLAFYTCTIAELMRALCWPQFASSYPWARLIPSGEELPLHMQISKIPDAWQQASQATFSYFQEVWAVSIPKSPFPSYSSSYFLFSFGGHSGTLTALFPRLVKRWSSCRSREVHGDIHA